MSGSSVFYQATNKVAKIPRAALSGLKTVFNRLNGNNALKEQRSRREKYTPLRLNSAAVGGTTGFITAFIACATRLTPQMSPVTALLITSGSTVISALAAQRGEAAYLVGKKETEQKKRQAVKPGA